MTNTITHQTATKLVGKTVTHTKYVTKTKYVTTNEIAAILYNMETVKGMPIIANIIQSVDARLKKTNNPFNDVRKVSRLNILLNTDYQKGVENQLQREHKDISEYSKGKNTMPLIFGENNQFIGKFNGNDVLQYRPYDKSYPKTAFICEGKRISKKDIEPFLPTVSHATNQGTDKEILWRKLYLSNLLMIRINKQVYKIRQAK